MNVLLVVLGFVFALAGLGSYILILVDAFQDAVWKGLLMLVPCIGGLWWLYYAIWEYESECKFGIVALAIFGSGIGGMFIRMGMGH